MTPRPRAYLLCGPSLAGKSTAAKVMAGALPACVLSADEINAERGLPFGGEGLPETVWAETLQIQVQRFHRKLTEGRSVIIDDTLCYRWLRDRWRHEASRASVASTLLLLTTPKEVLLSRHATAAGSGQRSVLTVERLVQHVADFEWPTPDEHAILIDTPGQLESWLKKEQSDG